MKLRFVKIIASAAPLKNYCSFHYYAKGVDDDIIKKRMPYILIWGIQGKHDNKDFANIKRRYNAYSYYRRREKNC